MKTFLKILLIVVLVGGLIATLFYLRQKSVEKPVVYETTNPLTATIIKKTVATGSVVPRKEIEIKPQVSGIVERIYLEAGAILTKGDQIARVKIIPDMVVLNNAENRVNVARINVENTKKDFDRNKKLLDQQVIPEATFLPFETAYLQAQEELNAAKDNLQLIKEGVTSKNASTSNTIIRSTIDGMVLDVPVEEGNSVIEANTFNDGTTVASVADMSDLIFEGKVDESEVGKIREGMNLILKIGAIENETFEAELEYISPKGVEEDGAIQFEIKAAVKLKEGQFIRAGYSANADIVLDRRDSVLAIEEALLQFDGDSAYIEVKEGETYNKQYVEVGLSDGINIELLSDVSKDAEIKIWNRTAETGAGLRDRN